MEIIAAVVTKVVVVAEEMIAEGKEPEVAVVAVVGVAESAPAPNLMRRALSAEIEKRHIVEIDKAAPSGVLREPRGELVVVTSRAAPEGVGDRLWHHLLNFR